MKVRVASSKSLIDLLQHPFFRKQHPSRTTIQQLELDILEAEAREEMVIFCLHLFLAGDVVCSNKWGGNDIKAKSLCYI